MKSSKSIKKKLNLPFLIFLTCLLLTFLVWDHYVNSKLEVNRNIISVLVMAMGLLFSASTGLFMWSLERSKTMLEEKVDERTAELKSRNEELEKALEEIKTLRGFIPICAACKKIRNDKGLWEQIEVYLQERSDAKFSHTVCRECAEKLYPGYRLRDR